MEKENEGRQEESQKDIGRGLAYVDWVSICGLS